MWNKSLELSYEREMQDLHEGFIWKEKIHEKYASFGKEYLIFNIPFYSNI